MKRCVIVGGAEIKEYERLKVHLREDDYFIYCDCGLEHFKNLNTNSPSHELRTSYTPNLIVGDFDSYTPSPAPVISAPLDILSHDFPKTEIIALPREKDDTDTVFAAKEALRRGFREFLVIGAIGGRFDHSIGNIGLLMMLHESGAKTSVIDDYSEMEIIGTRKLSNANANANTNSNTNANTAKPSTEIPQKEDSPTDSAETTPTDSALATAYIPNEYSYFSLLSLFGTAHGVTITGAKFPTNNATFSPNYQYGVSNEVLPNETACVTIKEGAMLLVKVF